MIRFVVFDLGTVLSAPPDLYTAPAELLGVDPDVYRELYWHARGEYDAGGGRLEYWGPILKGLELFPTPSRIADLADLDAGLWLQLRPAGLALLTEVYSWGMRTAVLTNGPHALGRAIRDAEWAPLVDRVFVSAELHLAKPDPRVFEVVTAELGVAPEQIGFLDDRLDNILVAADAGWLAHHWIGDEDALAWAAELCERPQPS